ncbi:putative RNA binding protein Jsn1 [Blattamonas nauphoetae]|uniref:RNA binding protein Jsn1 n=1 Tax=Blattamonas nauphoetae TaxID=2049346 RepID=A0ABQ9Y641_9EUKA|nr:putative RNA binding protein Jsn1 [Blattamonas nauphoetae]
MSDQSNYVPVQQGYMIDPNNPNSVIPAQQQHGQASAYGAQQMSTQQTPYQGMDPSQQQMFYPNMGYGQYGMPQYPVPGGMYQGMPYGMMPQMPHYQRQQFQSNTTIYVGNLHPDVSQTELSDAFSRFGQVLQVKVIPARQCGFVYFSYPQHAMEAHRSMQNAIIHGQAVRVGWGKSDTPSGGAGGGMGQLPQVHKELPQNPPARVLWVGNITPEITREILTALFERHGTVESVRFLHEKKCAFVTYDQLQSAINARDLLDKQMIGNTCLRVNFGKDPDAPSQPPFIQQQQMQAAQHYIQSNQGMPIAAQTQAAVPNPYSQPPPNTGAYYFDMFDIPAPADEPKDNMQTLAINKMAELVAKKGTSVETKMKDKQKGVNFAYLFSNGSNGALEITRDARYYRWELFCWKEQWKDLKALEKVFEFRKLLSPAEAVAIPQVEHEQSGVVWNALKVLFESVETAVNGGCAVNSVLDNDLDLGKAVRTCIAEIEANASSLTHSQVINLLALEMNNAIDRDIPIGVRRCYFHALAAVSVHFYDQTTLDAEQVLFWILRSEYRLFSSREDHHVDSEIGKWILAKGLLLSREDSSKLMEKEELQNILSAEVDDAAIATAMKVFCQQKVLEDLEQMDNENDEEDLEDKQEEDEAEKREKIDEEPKQPEEEQNKESAEKSD